MFPGHLIRFNYVSFGVETIYFQSSSVTTTTMYLSSCFLFKWRVRVLPGGFYLRLADKSTGTRRRCEPGARAVLLALSSSPTARARAAPNDDAPPPSLSYAPTRASVTLHVTEAIGIFMKLPRSARTCVHALRRRVKPGRNKQSTDVSQHVGFSTVFIAWPVAAENNISYEYSWV